MQRILTFKFLILDSFCLLKFQIDKDYIILLIFEHDYLVWWICQLLTIYTCCASFFVFLNKNLKETAFNYCAQWSGVDDQKIDFYII